MPMLVHAMAGATPFSLACIRHVLALSGCHIAHAVLMRCMVVA